MYIKQSAFELSRAQWEQPREAWGIFENGACWRFFRIAGSISGKRRRMQTGNALVLRHFWVYRSKCIYLYHGINDSIHRTWFLAIVHTTTVAHALVGTFMHVFRASVYLRRRNMLQRWRHSWWCATAQFQDLLHMYSIPWFFDIMCTYP